MGGKPMEQLANSGVLGAVIAILLSADGIALIAIAAWIKHEFESHAAERQRLVELSAAAILAFQQDSEVRRHLVENTQQTTTALAAISTAMSHISVMLADHCSESREMAQAMQVAMAKMITKLDTMNGH